MTDTGTPNGGLSDAHAASADDANGVAHADPAWTTADALPHGDVVATPMLEADLPGDHYLLATSTISSEVFGSVDHALHQLTVATDLFDVPVIDFHDHSS